MVHIKKKKKEILKKKKDKFWSGEETKARDVGIQEEAHYGGAFRRARLHMLGGEHLAVGGGGSSGMQGADRVMAKRSCLKTILPGLYLVRL